MKFYYPNKSRNKFKAIRTADGFPSKLEAAVYQMLLLREKTGEIKNINRQHRVELTLAKISSKIDFSFEKNNEIVYAEAKGATTERWTIIKRLWHFYGPGELEIWKGTYLNPILEETIIPKK